MKFLTKLAFILLVTLNLPSISAQTDDDQDEKLSLNSGTIDNQFEYVIQKSGKFQEYKVVKRTWLFSLKAHVLDSLKAVHKDLTDTQAVVTKQAGEIENLKSNLSNTESTLNATNDEKDNISLFGIQTNKASYKVLMWAIIGGLLALLLLFIYKFKGSNSATREAKFKLTEVETEFEEHRRNALEREQKVRRQLQDELNKHKS
ncbi:tRNA (guanine-N1)-methyltransferase [Winogradskyella undariae]|uniref:tRNA (guanine-N1)-methyltransferase n=1 Tax=Winogradskyella undariae TaxID=1285465 RepID=UPI00156AF1F4|nr:tRNA (guanine-N1)-methyltransferase [Winogradskyella undariae]NRR92315.1 tRNA (guanine-N1)-methyltransferase [Winogradskyella undariae]QNK78630.1 tRNA (guanine-N1)-methyltransferase [Winogradskyella sp. PAMC22761]